MSFPRYPEYKDSGVEWLGEVPTHWIVKQARYVLTLQRGVDLSSDLMAGHGFPVRGSNGEIGLHSECTTKGPGVTVGRSGSVGKVNYVDNDFWAHNTALYVKEFWDYSEKFVYYLLQSLNPEKLAAGSAVGTLDRNKIHCQYVAAPPIKEAELISEFLDQETIRIDALVEEQQRLIELLKEKRQAVISHAVTKGLDPDVPMKDSGVEWLGEVPVHWKIGSLKHALEVVADVDHYMPASVDAGVPYVMTGDLRRLASEISLNSCKQIAREDFLKLAKKIRTSKGDVIMARYATIGTVCYVDIDAEFIVSYSCVTIRPKTKSTTGIYLFFYFQSDAFIQGISNMINANTQENVGVGDLKEVKVALPEIHEQKAIVQELQVKLANLDRISKNSIATVRLLKERRSALISAAVTGKIDVRGWQPPPGSSSPTETTATELA